MQSSVNRRVHITLPVFFVFVEVSKNFGIHTNAKSVVPPVAIWIFAPNPLNIDGLDAMKDVLLTLAADVIAIDGHTVCWLHLAIIEGDHVLVERLIKFSLVLAHGTSMFATRFFGPCLVTSASFVVSHLALRHGVRVDFGVLKHLSFLVGFGLKSLRLSGQTNFLLMRELLALELVCPRVNGHMEFYVISLVVNLVRGLLDELLVFFQFTYIEVYHFNKILF